MDQTIEERLEELKTEYRNLILTLQQHVKILNDYNRRKMELEIAIQELSKFAKKEGKKPSDSVYQSTQGPGSNEG